jgi:hypothetical protein
VPSETDHADWRVDSLGSFTEVIVREMAAYSERPDHLRTFQSAVAGTGLNWKRNIA